MRQKLSVEFICKGCGTSFFDNPSQKRKFCCRACADKYKPKRVRQSLHCKKCGKEFYPIGGHLGQLFCSRECGYRRGRTKRTITIPKARAAQRLVSYYIDKGELIRPTICEECGQEKKIEAAHYNYDEPLKVRWLCRSCHVTWDKQNPKGATYAKFIGKEDQWQTITPAL